MCVYLPSDRWFEISAIDLASLAVHGRRLHAQVHASQMTWRRDRGLMTRSLDLATENPPKGLAEDSR
jgi:hypothetical protein